MCKCDCVNNHVSKNANMKGKASRQKTTKKTNRGKKGSLGRTLATGALGALGSAFGAPGAAIGSQVGNFLSDILGMGDYEVKSNSLSTVGSIMPATSGVPTFHSEKRSVRVKHREYLGDVNSSVAFALQAYSINPGLSQTFPWLSSLAENFQAYRFHGLVFEFWSTSSNALNNVNTALGTVVMATQYNAARANFTSKAEMEQYEFATSCKPSMSMIHPVECASLEAPLSELYIRTGALPAGEVLQFYDYGKFQLATVGMQNANNIGELWVSYDVELYKPRISPGLWAGSYQRVSNAAYDNNNTLGSIQTNPIGDIGITIVATGAGFDSILFPPSISTGAFQVTVIWRGTATALTIANPATTNVTFVPRLAQGGLAQIASPSGGTNNSAVAVYTGLFAIAGYSATGSKLQFTGLTLPTAGATVDIIVVGIPTTESFV